MSEATLVYDDDCGFCTWWADLFANHSDLRVVGFSDLSSELRDRLPEDYEECSHLVTDEAVYSCGASIEQALIRSDIARGAHPFVEFLRNFEEYDHSRECIYRWVAERRDLWGTVLSKTPPTRRRSENNE